MSFKLNFIAKVAKVYGWVKSTLGKVKTLFPKKTDYSKEIAELKADLAEHKATLREVIKDLKEKGQVPKVVEKLPEAPKEFEQLELYTSTAQKGKKGSPEITAYLLVNLEKSELKKIKSKIYDIDTFKLKNALSIPQEKIVVSVEKGESFSRVEQNFVDINGSIKKVSNAQDVLDLLRI